MTVTVLLRLQPRLSPHYLPSLTSIIRRDLADVRPLAQDLRMTT